MIESFSFSAAATGHVLHTEGFPSVWISEYSVEIDEHFIRTGDKAAVVAWLRVAADAIEAHS